MYKLIVIAAAFFITSCGAQKYFVVRHAEKASNQMVGDVPLSPEGAKQAILLDKVLYGEHIRRIYSTNFMRTIGTVQPLSKHLGMPIEIYDATKSKELAEQISKMKQNILVVGHSNTVDDIVNTLMNRQVMTDLPETEYGYIYLVKKKGKTLTFEKLPLAQ